MQRRSCKPRVSRKHSPACAALVEVVGKRAIVREDLVDAAAVRQWGISTGRLMSGLVSMREKVRGERLSI